MMATCPCPDRNLPGDTAECHCTGCGAHFSSPSVFDAHWQGAGDGRHCVDPATLIWGPESKRAGKPKFELQHRASGPVWVSANDGGENPFATARRAKDLE
jgi:hypothetical protein